MTFPYCNTRFGIVKTRTTLVGCLLIVCQAARAEIPSTSSRQAVESAETVREDDEMFVTLIESVGKIQSNADEKTKLTEQQRSNPDDRAVAVQIKALDDQNGAMVERADASAAKFAK